MREIFKAQLKEFHSEAYSCYRDEGSWDEDLSPEPMRGDKFYLLEKSSGDVIDKLILYSAREECCYGWDPTTRGWSLWVRSCH